MASNNAPNPQHDHKRKTWARDGFIVSTDPSLISISALTAAFKSPALYWAQALPESAMRDMIANSLCFGMYTPTPVPHIDRPASPKSPKLNLTIQFPDSSRPATPGAEAGPTLIGFARCITDYVTFLYLTDVYVLDEWQGHGLGSWLIQCVQEVVDSMPYLRRTMLITSNDESQGMGMYERRMKMSRIGNGRRRASIAERFGLASAAEGVKELIVMSAKGPGAVV